MMKRIGAIACIVLLLLSLVSCGAEKTVTRREWKAAFNEFGEDDFRAIVIAVNERVTEASEGETYGTVMTVTADFRAERFHMDGYSFWNDERYEIDDDSESFESGTLSLGEFLCSDMMREFWFEIEDRSDVGYGWFDYDDATHSYHAEIEIDDVLCDVNVYFENARIKKITLKNAERGDVTLSSVYNFTYK